MFNLKVRGSTARVFCNMSTGLTYIEATGVSTWGGGPSYITPSYKITHTFSKVQLVIDKCFTYINHADFTYSVMQPAPPLVAGRGWSFFHHGTLFGQAGDCGKDDGYGSIDLTQTGICFSSPSATPPPNKQFKQTNKQTNTHKQTRTNKHAQTNTHTHTHTHTHTWKRVILACHTLK